MSNRLLRAGVLGLFWVALGVACSSQPSGAMAGAGGDGSGVAGNANAGSAGLTAGNAGSGASLPACPTCVVLPIEVLGPTGTIASVSLNLPEQAAQAVSLSLQVHGLAFQAMASVEVNDGAWVSLSNQTVQLPEHQARYGGIGGGFATLKLTFPLSAGAIRGGQNTIRFRFDKTDGRTEGFRVLRINLLDAGGAKVLDDDAYFRDEDVSAWQPPSTAATDIATGGELWRSAVLVKSPLDETSIKAHCSDCHTQDARDLKYFNYSNHSIIERAKFHGSAKPRERKLRATCGRIQALRRVARGTRHISPGRA